MALKNVFRGSDRLTGKYPCILQARNGADKAIVCAVLNHLYNAFDFLVFCKTRYAPSVHRLPRSGIFSVYAVTLIL